MQYRAQPATTDHNWLASTWRASTQPASKQPASQHMVNFDWSTEANQGLSWQILSYIFEDIFSVHLGPHMTNYRPGRGDFSVYSPHELRRPFQKSKNRPWKSIFWLGEWRSMERPNRAFLPSAVQVSQYSSKYSSVQLVNSEGKPQYNCRKLHSSTTQTHTTRPIYEQKHILNYESE
jgi:hypothetical protein